MFEGRYTFPLWGSRIYGPFLLMTLPAAWLLRPEAGVDGSGFGLGMALTCTAILYSAAYCFFVPFSTLERQIPFALMGVVLGLGAFFGIKVFVALFDLAMSLFGRIEEWQLRRTLKDLDFISFLTVILPFGVLLSLLGAALGAAYGFALALMLRAFGDTDDFDVLKAHILGGLVAGAALTPFYWMDIVTDMSGFVYLTVMYWLWPLLSAFAILPHLFLTWRAYANVFGFF